LDAVTDEPSIRELRELLGEQFDRLEARLDRILAMTNVTDTERIDWLEKKDGWTLVSDDAGRWALVGNGMQNVPVEKAQWHKSVRDAIDASIRGEMD
jgi:hypothetical protein